MSKKFKSQASSSRAAASTYGSFGGFSSSFAGAERAPSSLTYVTAPPDLSRIADAKLAISFKNFLKKDEVTRIKALDEIKDYVSTVESRGATLDDGFLDAWVWLQAYLADRNLMLIVFRRSKFIHGPRLTFPVE
jgi:hypothetical protein